MPVCIDWLSRNAHTIAIGQRIDGSKGEYAVRKYKALRVCRRALRKDMRNFGNRNAEYGRGTGIPNPIDVHVGKRIRLRRLFLRMNQEALASQLGIMFEQVQNMKEAQIASVPLGSRIWPAS